MLLVRKSRDTTEPSFFRRLKIIYLTSEIKETTTGDTNSTHSHNIYLCPRFMSRHTLKVIRKNRKDFTLFDFRSPYSKQRILRAYSY